VILLFMLMSYQLTYYYRTNYNINKCVTEAMIYRAFKETHNRQHINYRTNLRKGEKKEKKKRVQ